MLAQAASCFAPDISTETVPGGFWTPASIFGEKLITRLERHSGLTFEIIE
jgi:saccharopine dehydrogenase (NAD+, L-glutamate forming)